MAYKRQVLVDHIHRALATVTIAAMGPLGVVVDEPSIQIRLEVFGAGVEALA